jgi:phosphoenolpyruvate phosphomutase
MIVARIESLIAGAGLDDALGRARVYVSEGGADAVMIHSKDRSGEDVTAFMAAFKAEFPEVPVVLVPTTYNHLTEEELAERGASVIIHANHLLRASYLAMESVAESILEHHRSEEADSLCLPIKDVLTLIPEE